MRKFLRFTLLTALVSCMAFVNARALDQIDGVYQINTAQDLADFSKLVAAGSNKVKCVINADLDFTGVEFTPIGTSQHSFQGSIDGQFHKISNLVIESDKQNQGLAGLISGGATFKNIEIDASCSFKGASYTAAFAGGASGSGTAYFENLINRANVTSTGVNAAAIVGVSMDAAVAFKIKNCYNTGNVVGTDESAIISGWMGSGSDVTNFFNVGTLSGQSGTNKLYRNSATTSNMYDIEGVQGTAVTIEALESGAMAFLFNAGETDSPVWYQNVDAGEPDQYPVFDKTHGTVYFAGKLNCDLSLPEDYMDSGFSNTASATQYTEHDYVDGVCSACHNVVADFIPKTDSVYEISDAKQLYWFASYVNKLDGEKAYARLLADIDFSEYTQQDVMIGSEGHDFYGWFDGQEHTVTVSFDTEITYAALFRSVKDGGVVRNLTVAGDNVSSAKLNAGIIGFLKGKTSKIENCISRVSLASTIEGDATMGGVVAETGGGGIYNCAFLGSMDGAASYGNGGIAGWTSNAPAIVNCIVNAEMIVSSEGANNLFARNVSTITNCYYLADNGLSTVTGATQYTIAQQESGELAYLLNGKSSENASWFQNIDNEFDLDAEPYPFSSHGTVYAVGTLNCDGSPAEGNGYSNTDNSVTTPHNYVDGICDFCKKLQTDYIIPVDGYYEIATAEQLNWFAKYVNSIDNKINGKLTADIDFTKYTADSVTIGSSSYGGIFDGQGHNVKIAYDTHSGTESADGHRCRTLFGTIQNAVVRNLSTSGTVRSTNLTGGMILSTRASRVENCYSDVALSSDKEGDTSLGGITGDLQNHSVMTNCGFTGSIEAPNGTGNGGLCAYANGGVEVVIENSYVASESLIAAGENNAIFCRNNPTMNNCYYVDPGAFTLDSKSTEVSMDQVKSGELAFMLNGNVSGGEPWTQTIGTDAAPLPFGTAKVYAIGEVGCDGSPTSATALTYSNTEGTLTQPDHVFDSENVCGNCGARKIENGEQLNNLSEAINSGFANSDILVIVANDIDMTDYPNYVGIGTNDLPFTGTFEGNGHKISNMHINTTTPYQGLFGVVSAGAYIKDITVDNTCSVTVVDGGYAGGIAASTTGTGLITFLNCGNEADITVATVNAAGIIGVNMGSSALLRLTNCYNAGHITGNKECSAISGWLGQAAELTNCYNIGQVDGLSGANTFYRYSSAPTVVNCYETIGTQTTNIAEEKVASGELCYLLNDSVSGGENFFQTLGTDAHPVLYKTHAKVYEVNGSFTNDVTGIKTIDYAAKGDGIERIYTLDGVRVSKLQKGVNIVRKADGTVRKVLVK